MSSSDLRGALAALAEQPTITVPILAVLLGTPPATVYAAIRRGQLPSIRIGRRVLVPSAAVRAMLGMGAGSTQPLGTRCDRR